MINYFDPIKGLEQSIDYLRKNSRLMGVTKRKAGIWQASEIFQDMEMFVIENHCFSTKVPTLEVLVNPKMGVDLPWAEDHFQERVGGKPTNPGDTYKYWPYNTFKECNDPYKDGKQFSHTYQERFWPRYAKNKPNHIMGGIRYEYGDLNDVINQLGENPLTRQAYLPIFFPEDTGAVHKQRVPCTLGYYFWITDGKLNCNYIIRSCDALRHFRNDYYLTARLVQYVADKLKIETGRLDFFIFNFHLFENDLYAINKKEHLIRNGQYGKNK